MECFVDIKSLTMFVKIVQLQSFTRTAEEMCVTQPTIIANYQIN